MKTNADDLKVLGDLTPGQAADKLRAWGEDDVAELLEEAELERPHGHPNAFRGGGRWWPFQDRPWQHTSHIFGYLMPDRPQLGPAPIFHAANIRADHDLQHCRLAIHLESLRIFRYPGGGRHRLLLGFESRHSSSRGMEPLYFCSACQVQQGNQSAEMGRPLFSGLQPSHQGTSFGCRIVKVEESDDFPLLDQLESPVLGMGLSLAGGVQPALPLYTHLGTHLTLHLARRERNALIQRFDLGLRFGDLQGGARLAEGTYLAVQVPPGAHALWNWDDWAFDRDSNLIVPLGDEEEFRFNYLVFSLRRWEGD